MAIRLPFQSSQPYSSLAQSISCDGGAGSAGGAGNTGGAGGAYDANTWDLGKHLQRLPVGVELRL